MAQRGASSHGPSSAQQQRQPWSEQVGRGNFDVLVPDAMRRRGPARALRFQRRGTTCSRVCGASPTIPSPPDRPALRRTATWCLRWRSTVPSGGLRYQRASRGAPARRAATGEQARSHHPAPWAVAIAHPSERASHFWRVWWRPWHKFIPHASWRVPSPRMRRWRTYLQPGVKSSTQEPFSEWEVAVAVEVREGRLVAAGRATDQALRRVAPPSARQGICPWQGHVPAVPCDRSLSSQTANQARLNTSTRPIAPFPTRRPTRWSATSGPQSPACCRAAPTPP
jgi:hypothetical protein